MLSKESFQLFKHSKLYYVQKTQKFPYTKLQILDKGNVM